ncbi:hypothetical protein CJ030_MR5G021759 [Morella rubra]|uniref:Uncharacterized protein n=1 Tax=Morella rubra TaxID=262757 RepID=A0A6A1VJZ4_9ROSI|nr:hypothetical protein CJ030_MR5G021759 [Morella rubra]
MSSSRSKLPLIKRPPLSVQGQKKGRSTEEPAPTPEACIYSESGFDFKEMFEFQGWVALVNLKVDCYVYLVKLGSLWNVFHSHVSCLEVDLTGEVREKPKESKEYNKKTLRLMGFMQNEDGEWVRKGVVTPQKGGRGSESEEESEDEEEGH